MLKEKTKIYIIEILLVVILSICTLLHYTDNKIFLALITVVGSAIISMVVRRERSLQIHRKKIVLILSVFAILYIAIFYMFGLYTGFVPSKEILSLQSISTTIIPIIIIIFSTERMRDKLLICNDKKSKFLLVVMNTIIELSLYLNFYKVTILENVLALVGFVSFAAIANNLLYNYLQDDYGKKPVIIYRLITTVVPYLIPVTPNLYIFYRTFLRLLYPLIIFLYLEKYFNEDYLQKRKREQKREIVSLVCTFIFLTILIGLISCKFQYGILVIGSNSMTGSINKGDVIFYKKTNDISMNDIIVYDKDRAKIVHRVVDVKNINNEQRYYTKGDANKLKDEKYVTNDNVIGKVLFRIQYLGNPTLFLRNIFK